MDCRCYRKAMSWPARVQSCPMWLQDVYDWNTHDVSLHQAAKLICSIMVSGLSAFSKPYGCLRMITEDSVNSGDTGGRTRIAETPRDFDKFSPATRLSHLQSNGLVVPCCDVHSIWCLGNIDCVVPSWAPLVHHELQCSDRYCPCAHRAERTVSGQRMASAAKRLPCLYYLLLVCHTWSAILFCSSSACVGHW